MTSVCTVQRVTDGPAPFPLPPDWDGGTQTLWEGACRLQQLNREQSVDVAGQPTQARHHLIAFPYDPTNPVPELWTGERGDTVHISGRAYTLMQRLDSSEGWQHDFIASENQTQNNP